MYGIWSDKLQRWALLATGEVFHTRFLSVARAQLQHMDHWKDADDWLIHEIAESGKPGRADLGYMIAKMGEQT